MEDVIVIRKRNWNRLKLLLVSFVLLVPVCCSLKFLYDEWGFDSVLPAIIFFPIALLFLTVSGIFLFFFVILICEEVGWLIQGDIFLIADGKGVRAYQSTMNVDFVPWKEVERIYLNYVDEKPFIEFVFRDENKFLRRFSKREKRKRKMERVAGHELVYLSFANIDMSPETFFERMQAIFEKSKIETR
ncbi:MAG: STM3941 family protein [Anaerotignum sp.]